MVLSSVRWYCKYGISYRDLKEMTKERGVEVDHATMYRWAQLKYLNNRIEADPGKLKRLIKPTLGFKSIKTAFATIKGLELMRMFKKGQFDVWKYGQGQTGEVPRSKKGIFSLKPLFTMVE
jgi:transposase-like protein